jgi:hypothetical protein
MSFWLVFFLAVAVAIFVTHFVNALFPPECPDCALEKKKKQEKYSKELDSCSKQTTDDLLDSLLD